MRSITTRPRHNDIRTVIAPGDSITEIERYPDTLVVSEAAHLLRISAASVYRAVRRGLIPSIRINRRVLIPKRAILDLMQGRRQAKGD